MKKLLVTIILPLFFQFTLYGQDLDHKVDLEFNEVPLEQVLQELSEEYKIRFSYGGHPAALLQRISIQAQDVALGQVLNRILKEAGLTYKVIGGNIVLRALEQKDHVPDKTSDDKQEEVEVPAALKTDGLPQDGLPLENLPRLDRVAPPAPSDPDPPVWEIRKVRLRTARLPTEKEQPSALMVAPVFSLGIARMNLQSAYASNQQLASGLSYSLGGAGVWELSNKLIFEIQFLYRRKGFTVHYGLQTLGDPIGIPVETEVEMAYFEVPLELNLSLVRQKPFILYGVGGLFGSYLMEKKEMTLMDDGRLFNTTAMHTQSLAEFLWGMHGGVSLSYSHDNKIFIFISPAYQYTVNPMKGGTQQILLKEYILRSGVRFRL